MSVAQYRREHSREEREAAHDSLVVTEGSCHWCEDAAYPCWCDTPEQADGGWMWAEPTVEIGNPERRGEAEDGPLCQCCEKATATVLFDASEASGEWFSCDACAAQTTADYVVIGRKA